MLPIQKKQALHLLGFNNNFMSWWRKDCERKVAYGYTTTKILISKSDALGYCWRIVLLSVCLSISYQSVSGRLCPFLFLCVCVSVRRPVRVSVNLFITSLCVCLSIPVSVCLSKEHSRLKQNLSRTTYS